MPPRQIKVNHPKAPTAVEGSKSEELKGHSRSLSLSRSSLASPAEGLCRKHRERKETYIKSLEQQVLQLLNQQSIAADEKRAVEKENAMLRGKLEHYGLSVPSQAGGFGPAATISMLDAPGGRQRLQVTMPETSPDYLAAFDASQSPLPRESASPEASAVEVQFHSDGVPSIPPPVFHTNLPADSVEIHPALTPQASTSGKGLPPVAVLSVPRQPGSHPNGLDATQVGIDFVLALENPCLHHTRADLDSTESYGHMLTTHAPLLSNGPRPLQPASSWTIPVVEIERLLNLSSQLNLAGELTPVQAWSRIKSYPGFEKLNLDQFEILEKALLKEVRCYGYVDPRSIDTVLMLTKGSFGAVMDEVAFENILRQCFYGL